MNSCDTCANYTYDEEAEAYFCDVAMDEDDYASLSRREFKGCPYYQDDDDYKIVRHQM